MKILHTLLPTLWLVALMGCAQELPVPEEPPKPEIEEIEELDEWLRALPGVRSVKELQTQDYQEYYLIQFEQLLDPLNPAAGTFLQRVFLSHQDFDNPVVFETEGYNAQASLTKSTQTELTKRYKANRVEVEHRYSGLSLPTSYNWNYLNTTNAAADLHAVRVALGTAYTGSWIATGVSKGGTNAMNYTRLYPEDLTATVAYVGPICNSLQDTRFVDHILNVATPEMRQKVEDFQRELLIRRNTIQPEFYADPAEPTEAKEFMTNDQAYESYVVDFVQGVWQFGWPVDKIPAVDATDQEIIDYLILYKVFSSDEPSPMPRVTDRSRTFIGTYLRKRLQERASRASGEPDTSNTHYYVQSQKELGYYAFHTGPFEDLIPDHASWSENTLARFTVPADAADIQFSDKLYRQMTQWLQNDDPQLICVYGEYDPWTAAAPDRAYFSGKANMAIFVEQGGSHSAEIERLNATDKEQAWSKLDSWVNQ